MAIAVATRVRLLWSSLALIVVLASCTSDDRPAVETVEIGSDAVTQTISAPAVVEAADRQPVIATLPGVVAEINAKDGAEVQRGDVVVLLASDDVELALKQAQAAEAALASAQTPVSVAPPGTAATAAASQAVADMDADVKPTLAEARRAADRSDDVKHRKAARNTVALLEAAYHDVRSALLGAGQAAAAQLNGVAASFSGALTQALGQASAGQAAQAAGAADTAAAQAEDLELRAPFSGVVELGQAATAQTPSVPDDLAGAAGGLDQLAGGLAAGGSAEGGRLRVGAAVTVGQTVFTVYDLTELFVRAEIDEIDAPQLEVGQQAEVLLDAFPDQTFRGEVTSVAIEAQTSSTGGVAYPARIRLLDLPRDGRPKVGMTASAEIITRTVDAGLAVPARAIVRREGGQAVFVVRDNSATLVRVQVEVLGEELAAVRAAGLRRGDQVIVSGYEDLNDGDAVRVQS